MTTANKITIFRVVLIPVFLVLAYAGLRYWAFAVFVLASLSDMLDGYIAMDPLADKVLVMAAMCFFVERGCMPGWVLAIVLLREFAVSGMRLVAVEQGRVIAAAWSGKVKTAVTMIGLCAMLLFCEYPWVNILVSLLILLTTVYSGVEYFYKNRDVFRNVE